VKLPEHWAKATAEDVDPAGKRVAFTCGRSSDNSVDDARRSALEVAQRALKNWLAGGWRSGQMLGRYGYGSQPMREEVLERFQNEQGETIAAVTQNAYGALVLNSARAMFIDLDFPPYRPGEWFWNVLKRLLRRPVRPPEVEREAAIESRLEQLLQRNPGWSVRLYRTFAGMRALVTHAPFDPSAAATRELLESLGADPLYIRLCKAQECFRARISPKPWRCDHTANHIRWPRETEPQQRQFERWQQQYLQNQSDYATCRFVATLGTDHVDPNIQPIIDIHDRTTKCHESMALA
jgi:hypothetical protein